MLSASGSFRITNMCTGYLDDLFYLDTFTLTWTDLSPVVQGLQPFPRVSHGFVSNGTILYLFGGWNGGEIFPWHIWLEIQRG